MTSQGYHGSIDVPTTTYKLVDFWLDFGGPNIALLQFAHPQ